MLLGGAKFIIVTPLIVAGAYIKVVVILTIGVTIWFAITGGDARDVRFNNESIRGDEEKDKK